MPGLVSPNINAMKPKYQAELLSEAHLDMMKSQENVDEGEPPSFAWLRLISHVFRASPSDCLSVSLFVTQVCMSASLSVFLSFCLSVFLSFCPDICMSACLFFLGAVFLHLNLLPMSTLQNCGSEWRCASISLGVSKQGTTRHRSHMHTGSGKQVGASGCDGREVFSTIEKVLVSSCRCPTLS
jgi:hypothetical protein